MPRLVEVLGDEGELAAGRLGAPGWGRGRVAAELTAGQADATALAELMAG